MVRTTSARPSGGRPAVPAKMTSSILPPRNDFAPCSPSTQAIASTTLDFPEPFGPTTQVIPGSKRRVVGAAKDLKPFSVRLLRCTSRLSLRMQRCGGEGRLGHYRPGRRGGSGHDEGRPDRDALPVVLCWLDGDLDREGRQVVLDGKRRGERVVGGPDAGELSLELRDPAAQSAHLVGQPKVGAHADVTEQGLRHMSSALREIHAAGPDSLCSGALRVARQALRVKIWETTRSGLARLGDPVQTGLNRPPRTLTSGRFWAWAGISGR